MYRVLLPNLFFEDELQTATTVASTGARQLVAEIGPVMGLLAEEIPNSATKQPHTVLPRSIVLISEGARPDDLPPALQSVEFLTINELAARVALESHLASDDRSMWDVVPWGWSDSAVTVFRKVGLPVNAPDCNVVKSINSRQFQSRFDAAIDMDGTERTASFGTLCHSQSDVTAAIKAACTYSQRGWVIKADLSHASRNRLLGTSTDLSSEHRAWLESRIESGGCVYVEPWVERISECGLQFFVPPSASPTATIEFIGATEMLNDEMGRYRGSLVRSALPETVWQPAIDHCFQIARTAAMQGYFGPLGIDCMIFRSPESNRRWLRFSHDINGRLTMGRIALSLRKFLEPGETGAWIHADSGFGLRNGKMADEVSHPGVRIIHTSPGRISGKLVRTKTALVVSKDSDRLKDACRQILGQSVNWTQSTDSDQELAKS